jgi:hypothetical protein
LWDEFKRDLCDDLRRFLYRQEMGNLSDEAIFDYGLHLIKTRLRMDDKTMENVGLSRPLFHWNSTLSSPHPNHPFTFERDEQTRLLQETLPRLNADQCTVFDVILKAALSHAAVSFFLQGAAGAGKTFVYNTLCFATRSRDLQVLCVVSSGIAALLLPGGRTAHSTLKILIDIDECSMCSVLKRSSLGDTLRNVQFVVWDECSMQHRFAFEAVDQTLQDVRSNPALFGGIPTILGGDFLQTLPVVTHSLKSDILNAALFSSMLWPHVMPRFLCLEKNMRVGDARADQDFSLWQRQLARGLLNDENDEVIIPDTLIAPSNDLSALIECTYPDISSPHNMDYFCKRCILAPRNRETNEMNDIILDKFPGQVHDLWAVDDAFDPDTEMTSSSTFPPKVLHSATPSGFPQAHLKLKIGCPVIVLHNLHSEEGICNGSRGIVTRISTRVVEVLLHGGEMCLVPRIKLISRDSQLPFHLHHRQFPLALSFAITINKSQGQSFTTVGIDL